MISLFKHKIIGSINFYNLYLASKVKIIRKKNKQFQYIIKSM